jgi:predicted MFS family arabinose efflux permease
MADKTPANARPHEPSDEQTGKQRPLALAVALLGLSSLPGWMATIPVFAPRLQQEFGMSNRQLGTLMSCVSLGGLIAFPFILSGVHALGTRRVVQIGLMGVGAGFLLCGLTRGVLPLEAGLTVAGMFGTALAVTTLSLLVGLFPEWKRRMLSLTLAVFPLPSIVFPPIAQHLLSASESGHYGGFRAVFHTPFVLVGAVLVAGGIALSASNVRKMQIGIEDRRPVEWRRVMTWSTALIVVLAALHGGPDNALSSWVPKLMTGRFAELPVAPGMVLALYSLGYTIARVLQSMLGEGVGQRFFLTATGPIGGALMLTAIWRGDAMDLALLYPVAGFIWCLEYPSLLSEVETVSSEHFSTVMAVGNLTQIVMSFGLMNLIGWLADRTGSLQTAVSTPVFGFMLFGLLAAVTGLGRRRPADTIITEAGA